MQIFKNLRNKRQTREIMTALIIEKYYNEAVHPYVQNKLHANNPHYNIRQPIGEV